MINYPVEPSFSEHLSNFPNIKNNWNYSVDKLNSIAKSLSEVFMDNSFTIVIAGSYGRLEASSNSDFDYFILSDDPRTNYIEIKNNVNEVLKKVGIDPPNADGVFSKNFQISDLLDGTGSHEDYLPKLGQRMLLLMESRPIYNETLFKETVGKALDKYLDLVKIHPKKECVFLLNDLIRYFRSMAVNYQFTFWKDSQKWTIRNIKLRHSRVLIYAGVLLLILEASTKGKEKHAFLENNIYKTPLEKLFEVIYISNKSSMEVLFQKYDLFLGKMNDENVRTELSKVEYEHRTQSTCYMELKKNSDAFLSDLSKFVFSKIDHWSEEVMTYLIF